jgi:hypothetical protein
VLDRKATAHYGVCAQGQPACFRPGTPARLRRWHDSATTTSPAATAGSFPDAQLFASVSGFVGARTAGIEEMIQGYPIGWSTEYPFTLTGQRWNRLINAGGTDSRKLITMEGVNVNGFFYINPGHRNVSE